MTDFFYYLCFSYPLTPKKLLLNATKDTPHMKFKLPQEKNKIYLHLLGTCYESSQKIRDLHFKLFATNKTYGVIKNRTTGTARPLTFLH